jgi:ATP-dependent HslUV protease ATP-binding subunit HslU
MERLLEDILFDAPDVEETRISIDSDFVERQLADIARDQDLSRYIL